MGCFKLYNIVIDADYIIGVGPLRRLTRNDAQSVAYQSATFEFQLFTTGGIVIVSTNELPFARGNDQQSKEEYQAIKSAWQNLVNNLLAGIDLSLGFQDTKNE